MSDSAPVSFSVCQSSQTTSRQLSVLALIDHSLSTEGVRSTADDGLIALASNPPSGTRFRVLGFHDSVFAITDWTDNFAVISNRLRTSRPSGPRTALAQAIEVAIRDIESQPGERVIVLFTDGRGNVAGGPAIDQLVAACKAANIRVMAIGLENKDLDATYLQKLSQATGGRYFSASQQSELVERFRNIRTQWTRPTYRLAILNRNDLQWPLSLAVGSGPNAIQLSLQSTQINK